MSLHECESDKAFVQYGHVPGRKQPQFIVKLPIKGSKHQKVLATCLRPEYAEMIVNALRFWSQSQGDNNA